MNIPNAPIARKSLAEIIAGKLAANILDGQSPAGTQLAPERDLVKEFGVSRPSLREALNSLVATGFLEVVQGNRTVVRSLVSGKIFEPLDNLLKEDSNAVFELIEVRKAIETWNAYLAAKRASREDISHLEEIIESMKKSLEKGGPFPEKEDADFHMAITLATHNKIQTHVMHTLHDILKESIEKYYHKLDEEVLFEQHLGIVEALKEKNSELARTRISQHLEYVESCVREGVESEKGSNDR